MDPTTAALAAEGGGKVAGGIAAYQSAKAEQRAANINSYIARTRAAQADTDARVGLDAELGSMRAALAANGQSPNVGTFEMFRELRDVRNRERRVSVGNLNQEARDFKTAGRNAAAKGQMAMLSGASQAAPSLFDLYQGI